MTDVQKTFFRDSHLQVCLLRHHDRRHSVKKREQRIGMLYSSIENGEVYKIQNLTGKRIHVCGLVALHLQKKLQICKLCDIRAIRRPQADYVTKKDEVRKSSLQARVQFIFSVDWARDHYSIAEAGLEIELGVHTLVHKKDKHFLYNGGCTICFDNNASEAEVITDTKKLRKVNHQIQWRPEQNAKDWIYLSATQKRNLADKVWAIIMFQSLRWKNAL